MQRWCEKVAVVTGASAGIGKAIAETLSKNGTKCVGIARRPLPTEPFAFHYKQCDITDTKALEKTLEEIERDHGPIHILINNAGMVKLGLLCEEGIDDWRKLLDLNVLSLLAASRFCIASMRRNNIAGHIININSVSGHKIIDIDKASIGLYPASKFSITAICEILRQELSHLKTGIKVTSLSPGYVENTEIFGPPPEDSGDSSQPALQPQDVADAVVYALSTPARVLIKELTIKDVNERF